MTIVETPQSFVVRDEYGKAAWQHGFRRVLGEYEGWAAFGILGGIERIFVARDA
jgi:hypothetical protein